MKTKTILLAEDSPNDVELTLAALAEHHLANNVVVTRDGAEALDYLYRRGQFADRSGCYPVVVLLDLKMPKVDGLEVLRQVKSDKELRRIPVVLLTSSREDKDLIESYHLGANGYVVKPVVFDKFTEAIKSIGLYWVLTNEPPPEAIEKQD